MECTISQNEPLLDMKGVIGLKYKLIRLIGEVLLVKFIWDNTNDLVN